MLPQPPYVIVPPRILKTPLRTSINCKEAGPKYGLDGISIRLMTNLNLWKDSSQCYIANGCTFGDLVNWVANDTRLVVLNSLIRTPKRRMMKGVRMGVSIVDDELIVIGRSDSQGSDEVSTGFARYWALLKPLDLRVWIAVIGCFVICIVAVVVLKFSKPLFQWGLVENDRSDNQRGIASKPRNMFLTVATSMSALLGYGSLGATQQANRSSTRNDPHISTVAIWDDRRLVRFSWRMGLYNLSVLLLSFFVAFFFGVWVLFYQAALTNFLFQEADVPLHRSVRSLLDYELQNYTVLRDSGVSEAWSVIQQENTMGFDPWTSCLNIEECFDQVQQGKSSRLIATRTVATFHITNQSLCDTFTTFTPEDPLYKFNAGFVYGSRVGDEVSTQIDEALLNARLSDELRKTSQEFRFEDGCLKEEHRVTWQVWLVPTLWVNVTCILLLIGQICLIRSNHKAR